MTLKDIFAIVISLVPLGLLIASFPSNVGNFPEQVHARFIPDFVVWHSNLTNFDAQTHDTISSFIYGLVAFTSVLSVYWSLFYKPEKHAITVFHNGTHSAQATLFNAVIAIYCLVTLFAIVAFLPFDVSKLWSSFGVVHNVLEVSILLILIHGGRVASSWFFFTIAAYWNLVMLGTVALPWPYDALFFKIQGLGIDFMLVFSFLHLYNSTRKHHNKDDAESGISLTSEVHAKTQESLFPTSVDHPSQVWLLIIASFVHSAANVFVTIFPGDARAAYVLTWSCGIAFSMYAYYVYVETHLHGEHGEKRYYWPESSIWKPIVSFIFCEFLSTLLLRLLILAIE